MLCGGVGGARMARALSETVAADRLTVVVNVGDDDSMYGVQVAADIDTVVYTMAGIEGPYGWGIAGDTFTVMDELMWRGLDTSFRLGDKDLATCLWRTAAMQLGRPLSQITAEIALSLGVRPTVVPASDDSVATRVQIKSGEWLSFQEYFVTRQHEDDVVALEYQGAAASRPAPGVVEAVANADLVVVAPSNPPLSIWPILAIPGIRDSVAAAKTVVAVSPLFAGKTLKGPADRVITSLGLPGGTPGILAAYEGMLSALVVDQADSADVALSNASTRVFATDTRISKRSAGRRFAEWLLDTMLP